MLRTFASGRLFGASFGSPPAWVMALHGWRRGHRDFTSVLEGLDAIAVDLPGFGVTPSPPEPWATSAYASEVALLLDEMDRRGIVVVGHSFGGRVAVQLASARPERVRALVLTGAPLVRPPGTAPRRPPRPFRLARRLNRYGLLGEGRMEALRGRYGSDDYRAASPVMRGVLVKAVGETYEDQLQTITCPVELVWGDDDPQVPLAVAESAAALLARARLTVCPGAGHLVPLTAPVALREAIERHR